MARATISVQFDSSAPRNQAWKVVKTTNASSREVSSHRLKENAVAKARQLKGSDDSGVVWNKGMTGSRPL